MFAIPGREINTDICPLPPRGGLCLRGQSGYGLNTGQTARGSFVPAETVTEIRTRAEAAVEKRPAPAGQFTNVTKGLEQLDSFFDDIMRNGPQVPVLETLLGEPPKPTTASYFTKRKHDEEVHPHSDAGEGGVVWIALDAASEANGCLHFLRGSHLRVDEFKHLRPDTPTDLSDHPDTVAIPMAPGDIVFFRPTTVHWSGPNHECIGRRGFNVFYVGDPLAHLTDAEKAELRARKEQWQKDNARR